MKKYTPITMHKPPASSRFSLSPNPSHRGLSHMTPLTLYHRRNITSIIRNAYKHSSTLLSKLFYASDTWKGHSPTNPSKENQDSLFLQPFIDKEASLFGVCDGHGTNGKQISSFIATSLPLLLIGKPLSSKSLTDAIKHIEKDLHFRFDCSFSGSTLVCICLIRDLLIAVNIGDSRALLGRRGYVKWECIQLTRDHKPDLTDENERIRNAGGRVYATNNLGPTRVWLSDKNSPGLAMSRSLGDSVVHQVGVSSEPEIIERTLAEDDEFIVIGSDGLFEFLSNQDIIIIAGDNIGNPKAACEELISTARARWAKKQEAIDDISCIVVYFR